MRGLYADSWGTHDLQEFNPNHEPAGKSTGGQFARKAGGASATQASGAPGGGRDSVQASAAGLGKSRPAPDAVVAAEASAYALSRGLRRVDHDYVEVDQQRAGDIADLYDALPLNDAANPAVSAAYAAFAQELEDQWDYATGQGMRFEAWTSPGQPYQTSVEMSADVKNNRHLSYYTGGDPHPLLSRRSERTGLVLNDMFRALHDYYGHAAGGYGFGPRGEENAWVSHSQMFTPLARRAMTTETRGQNSWTNFGRQNYDADGNYKNIPAAERPFAVQKVALLPDRYVFGGG